MAVFDSDGSGTVRHEEANQARNNAKRTIRSDMAPDVASLVGNKDDRPVTRNDLIYGGILNRLDGTGKMDAVVYEDAISAIRNIEDEAGYKDLELSRMLKVRIRTGMKLATEHRDGKLAQRLYDVNRKVLLWEAPVSFDSFMLYMEIDRDMKKQFYLPRRKQLRPVAMAMQDLADHKLELLAISMPPGVGKTSLALFFLTWLGGRNPEKPILTGSHSNAFLRGAYEECNRLLDPQGEYHWTDVFPLEKVIRTNAQDMLIDIGTDKRSSKRFTTLEFSSIGSGNAGKVRAENLLYCDDLVDSLETALSRARMDKLWDQYTTDLRQRKIGSAVELHIATRWSVHDVIGRLEQRYGDSDKARFIVMPALDENDESNFDYPIEAGFTTDFYHQQRDVMDDASWRALYMNQPIEREGQLYAEEELRRYFELPEGEPDAIISVCDTKDRGSDYCVMPIAYQYGTDLYIEDVICDNSNPDVLDQRLINILVKHNVHISQFESNSAGGRVAATVQEGVRKKNGRTRIVTKYTTANKETKIIVNAPFVKKHFLFKDKSVIKTNKEYRTFMNMLCGYTMIGKNAHDDVPDACAMLAEYCQGILLGKAEIVARVW